MSVSPDTRYLTVAEAARRLDVSPSTVWRWIDARRLPAERVGSRKIRIREADLDLVVAPARVDSSASALAEPKPYVFVPPTKEELAARQAAYEEILEFRRKRPKEWLSATEALEISDAMQLEHDERLAGIRR